ncbi:SDR family NAD(P)-dependent oxidoreductase [Burkholderia sp. GS2Y]|uniref:SDR family oxidoreductase n=1 Tax=Burkholderia theae TaxID=3143496 RepID=A0ABU9WPE2_9BURK
MTDRRDRNAALEGRRILVTGAASGIGLKTAEVFVAAGADVVLLDRNADAVTLLQCQKPTVVTVASSMALSPTGSDPAYTASKGGVIALTKAVAASHAPRLRANVICPGATNTPMLRATVGDEVLANIVRQNPMKRIAEPEELAEAALFLTSDASSYITGTALAVAGGRVLH